MKKTPSAQPDYAAYWRAALERHKAMIAAGCLSPVGVRRVSGTAKKDAEDDAAEHDTWLPTGEQ